MDFSQIKPPREFKITRSNQLRSWTDCIEANLKPQVQAIVLILQGRKNAAPLYKDLKKLLTERFPLAVQVVLADTIKKGRNLTSITCKILI